MKQRDRADEGGVALPHPINRLRATAMTVARAVRLKQLAEDND